MNVLEFHNELTKLYPRELSCPWDNDGIMVCGDLSAEVKRVAVSLDASFEAVCHAAEIGADLLLTHHPMLFRGTKSVSDENPGGHKIIKSLRNGLSVISLHTRLDAGDGGVNDCLAEALGLKVIGKFGDEEAPELGRIALAEPVTGKELAEMVRDSLGSGAVRFTGDAGKSIRTVGLCGGDGKDFLQAAAAAGCDAYITGDAGYNAAQDISEEGLCVIEAGHYHSEAPVCKRLAELAENLCGAETYIYDSCAYRII